jgi:ribosomal protein L7Ae-like RNA K-turn-binding protein
MVIAGPPALELGSAAGRETAAVVGIVDKGLAKGIRALSPEPMRDVRQDGEE